MQQVGGVSVAMATFDGERFLGAQLNSIASQSVRPAELVINDDGSSDATIEIVRAFAARAPFPVSIAVNEVRLGSTRNFEAAIRRCSGQVIFLADQDDVWQPEKVAVLTSVLEANPAARGCFSDASVIDETGSVVHPSLWQHISFTAEEQERFRGREGFEILVQRNVATGATICFRAHEKDLLLPFPSEHALVHDRWIAMLLSVDGGFIPVSQPLIGYRRHGGQQIGPGPATDALQTRVNAVRETGRRQFREWAGQLELLRARLMERGVSLSPERAREIEQRIEHLRARAAVPDSWLERVPSVAREVMTGRYSRYSNHLWSAAKDLFRVYRE